MIAQERPHDDRGGSRASRLPSGLAIGAVIAMVAVAVQGFRLPGMIAGRHLAVLAGLEPDPHLLTGWVDYAIGRACSVASPCTYLPHLICLALGTLLLTYLAVKVAPRWSPLRLTVVVGILALSPFVSGPVIDPIGVGSFVTIVIFVLAAGDTAELYSFRPALRCFVALALSLQDPLLAPAAILYPLIAAGSLRRTSAWAASIAGVVGFATHAFATHQPLFAAFSRGIDPIAGPIGIIAIGILAFIAAPIYSQVSRSRAFEAFDLRRKPVRRTILLGIVALGAGLFSESGDPTPYWLSFEAALTICILPVVSGRLSRRSAANGILVAALALELFAVVAYERYIPSRVIAFESVGLRDILRNARAPICLASDDSGQSHVLADGAFLQLFAGTSGTISHNDVLKCLPRLPEDAEVATIHGLDVERWGEVLAVIRAARGREAARYQFVDRDGSVDPRTSAKTPNGLGAFGNILRSPVGPIDDITILSGYRFTFACRAIPRGTHISFAAATIAGSPTMHFNVAAGTGRNREAIGSGDVERQTSSPLPAWRYFSFPVPNGSCMTVDIEVTSPTDGASGRWMTFAAMALK